MAAFARVFVPCAWDGWLLYWLIAALRTKRTIAAAEGVRFLDMVNGFKGHEICASGASSSTQWVNGLLYEPQLTDFWEEHAVQQSFHPNAKGHAQIANCVDGFVSQSWKEGICEVGSSGNDVAKQHP